MKLRKLATLAGLTFALLVPAGTAGAALPQVEILKDLNPGPSGFNPYDLTRLGNRIVLSGKGGAEGNEPWVLNGSSASLINDLSAGSDSSEPSGFKVLGNSAYFMASTPATGRELFRTDGDSVEIVEDLVPGPDSSSPYYLKPVGDFVYFQASTPATGSELFRAGPGGIDLVSDINPGVDSSYPSNMTAIGSYLYYMAYTPASGYEPRRTDGAIEQLVHEVSPGADSSYPGEFAGLGGNVYFTADDGTNGYELWKFDGVSGSLVADLEPGAGSSYPYDLTGLNDRLYFTVDQNSAVGSEPFWTDGGMPTLLQDIVPGPEGSNPEAFHPLGNFLYFNAGTEALGFELYRTDGTNTALFEDFFAGEESSNPYFPTQDSDGRLFVSAYTPETGYEPYEILPAGPRLLKDVLPGPSSSEAVNFVSQGDRVLFTADDGTRGFEIWTARPDREINLKVVTRKRIGVSKKGFAGLKLNCPADEANGPCKTNVSVTTRKAVRVGNRKRKVTLSRKMIQVIPGNTGTARLRFSRKNIALLLGTPAARKVTVVVKTSDRAGNSKTIRRAFVLGRPS